MRNRFFVGSFLFSFTFFFLGIDYSLASSSLPPLPNDEIVTQPKLKKQETNPEPAKDESNINEVQSTDSNVNQSTSNESSANSPKTDGAQRIELQQYNIELPSVKGPNEQGLSQVPAEIQTEVKSETKQDAKPKIKSNIENNTEENTEQNNETNIKSNLDQVEEKKIDTETPNNDTAIPENNTISKPGQKENNSNDDHEDLDKIDLKKIYLPSISDTPDKKDSNKNTENKKDEPTNPAEIPSIEQNKTEDKPNENVDKEPKDISPQESLNKDAEVNINDKSKNKNNDKNKLENNEISIEDYAEEMPKNDKKEDKKEDKDLEQFLKNEVLILGVEDDEVMLGMLTTTGFINSLEYEEYIKYMNLNLDRSEFDKNTEREKAVEEIIEISWRSRNNQKYETNFLKKIEYDSLALSLLVINYAKKNDVNNLASLFYRHPYLVGVKDCVGNNLLQIATYSGAYDVSRYLISIGISLDNKSVYGIDPYGSADIMEDKRAKELIFKAKK